MDKLLYTSLIALGFLAVSATASMADKAEDCATVCQKGVDQCEKEIATSLYSQQTGMTEEDAEGACQLFHNGCNTKCIATF